MSTETRTVSAGERRPDPQAEDPGLSRAPWLKRSGMKLLPLAFILVILVVWELISQFTDAFPDYILPAPTAIVERMFDDAELLWSATRVTLVEVVVGYVAGALIGLALAVPIAYSATVRATLYPLIVASRRSRIAIGPLLVLWLGLGMLPKLAIVAMMVFFPVVITAAEGSSRSTATCST